MSFSASSVAGRERNMCSRRALVRARDLQVLAIVAAAADGGLLMPTNKQIAAAVGVCYRSVPNMLYRLIKTGDIRIIDRRAGHREKSRQVEIVATGAMTASVCGKFIPILVIHEDRLSSVDSDLLRLKKLGITFADCPVAERSGLGTWGLAW